MGCLGFMYKLVLLLCLTVSSSPWRTISTINDLANVDFGHDYPRHGRNLLYWFCSEYITFDNNNHMRPVLHPRDGAFGFHYFGNNERLLPRPWNARSAYYIVGNLNLGAALPYYVREEYINSRWDFQSNRDRIIIRMTPYGTIDQVYITQHVPCGNTFDEANTFRMSHNLMQNIGGMTLENFRRYFPSRSHDPTLICHDELRAKRSVEKTEEDHSTSKRKLIVPT